MTQLRPSNAGRFMECGGTVALCANTPDYHDAVEDTAAEEGIAAHWVFEQMHRAEMHDLPCPVKEGSLTPNKVIVTEEMLDYAAELCAIVPKHATVEAEVDLSGMGMRHKGTRDVSWREGQRIAHILDYKFGHRFVDEFENWQLLFYAGDLNPADYDVLHFHIYQPRCYGRAAHRVWTVTMADYRQKYYAEAVRQIALINEGKAPLRVGAHCYRCPAGASCPALAEAGHGAMDELYIDSSPHVLNPQQLARELDALERAETLLNARKLAVEEQAHSVIRSGALVPGWQREQSLGRRAWTKDAAEVLGVGKAFGKDLQAPAKPITPTQAIKAGVPEEVINSLSHRPEGKMKLRKVDTNLARKVFNNG